MDKQDAEINQEEVGANHSPATDLRSLHNSLLHVASLVDAFDKSIAGKSSGQ